MDTPETPETPHTPGLPDKSPPAHATGGDASPTIPGGGARKRQDAPFRAPPNGEDRARAILSHLARAMRTLRAPALWPTMTNAGLEHMAFLACVTAEQNPQRARHVARLFATLSRRMTVPERLRMLGTVTAFVEEGRSSAHALLPFILMDASEAVVAVASREFAQLHPSPPRDPMQGVHRLVAEVDAKHVSAGRRAAVIAGLVTLGDARVEPWVLGQGAHFVGLAGRRSLACLQGIMPTTLMVEFLLDCLEHAATPALAVTVADALAELPRSAPHAAVVEIRRTFPSTAAPLGQELEVVSRVAFPDLLERVRPRLATVALLAEVEGGGALHALGPGGATRADATRVVGAVERVMDAWANATAPDSRTAAA